MLVARRAQQLGCARDATRLGIEDDDVWAKLFLRVFEGCARHAARQRGKRRVQPDGPSFVVVHLATGTTSDSEPDLDRRRNALQMTRSLRLRPRRISLDSIFSESCPVRLGLKTDCA